MKQVKLKLSIKHYGFNPTKQFGIIKKFHIAEINRLKAKEKASHNTQR